VLSLKERDTVSLREGGSLFKSGALSLLERGVVSLREEHCLFKREVQWAGWIQNNVRLFQPWTCEIKVSEQSYDVFLNTSSSGCNRYENQRPRQTISDGEITGEPRRSWRVNCREIISSQWTANGRIPERDAVVSPHGELRSGDRTIPSVSRRFSSRWPLGKCSYLNYTARRPWRSRTTSFPSNRSEIFLMILIRSSQPFGIHNTLRKEKWFPLPEMSKNTQSKSKSFFSFLHAQWSKTFYLLSQFFLSSV